MEVLDVVKQRFSVRKFKADKIEAEKLNAILEVARYAPTAVNYQAHRIYVLESDAALEKINSVCRCIFGAPLVLLFCYDENIICPKRHQSNHNFGEIDTTIVCDEMLLTAWSLGLGSCYVGAFDPQQVAEVFNLPENEKPVLLLPLGYAAPDCEPLAKMHNVSRPLTDMISRL